MTQRTSNDSGEFLRPGEAAGLLHLHTRTLTRMAERGEIRSLTLPSGHRRYQREDIESLRNRAAS